MELQGLITPQSLYKRKQKKKKAKKEVGEDEKWHNSYTPVLSNFERAIYALYQYQYIVNSQYDVPRSTPGYHVVWHHLASARGKIM